MNLSLGFVAPNDKERKTAVRAASLADALTAQLQETLLEMAADEPREVRQMALAMLAQTLMFQVACGCVGTLPN